MKSSIHSIIKGEYEKRQKASYDLLADKKERLYAQIPRLEEIETEIQRAGLKYNKQLLADPANAEEIISDLQAAVRRLKREKASLLEAAGYDKDYLEPVYKCAKCKDTGTPLEDETGERVCSCYRQQLIDLIYIQSNLKCTDVENFNCFNEKYYADVIDENRYGIKKSPRKQILGIKENCLQFIENFKDPQAKNMLFCGPTGSGKTFMANCTAVELMNRGITVLYQSAPVLFSTITEYRFKSSKDEAFENSVYKNIMEVELLIIDDLGTEPPSAARYAELLTILDTRFANNMVRPCKTLISTNIDIRKLYEYYDERVGSRIIGNFDIYRFAGDDIRKLKASLG